MRLISIAALLLISAIGCAPGSSKNPAGATDLEKMKELLGVWESDATAGSASEKVVYRVTSGGTAVEETLFPGTPNQMVSIYHLVDDNLQMTHYCALGNQPRLAGERTDTGYHFEFIDGENISPGEGHYINGMDLTFLGPNKIRHEWRSLQDGQPGEPKIIVFKRRS